MADKELIPTTVWEVYSEYSNHVVLFKNVELANNQWVVPSVDLVSKATVGLTEDEINTLNKTGYLL